MSSYNPPPPPPPEPNGPYGQAPYGQAPYGQAPYGEPSQAPAGYAHWGKRVAATLVDTIVMSLAYVPAVIGFILIVAGSEKTTVNGTTTLENNDIGAAPILLILLGAIAYLSFAIWNLCIKQGRTGYTIGKGVLGIKLIAEQNGQPIGAGKAFLRQIAHVLDSFCYIGYLWPLWDAKRQTFADKIMTTVVVNQPKD
ncbi:MAG: RDD family protein [Nocardioides sp.]